MNMHIITRTETYPYSTKTIIKK